MDSLFEQMSNLTKAHAYDKVAVPQINELKQIIRDLIEHGDLDDLVFTDDESTEKFKYFLKKAKILSL